MNFKQWLESQWQKFPRQKQFSFMGQPGNPYQRYSRQFLGGDVHDFGLDNSQYEPGKFYHVTTNLRAVKSDGKLKSRSELGGKGIGLGGGPNNMSPNMVSLTYNYSKAVEIYEGLKFVAEIVSGQATAASVYDYASGSNDNNYYDNGFTHFDQVIRGYGVPKRFILNGEEEKIKAVLNKKITTPEERYEFFQELEKAILNDNPPEDNSEYPQFDPVVGFTAPFRDIKGLTPNNIAIIQVVIRKNTNTSHYLQEAEIRVHPEDIAIVRYLQPFLD